MIVKFIDMGCKRVIGGGEVEGRVERKVRSKIAGFSKWESKIRN